MASTGLHVVRLPSFHVRFPYAVYAPAPTPNKQIVRHTPADREHAQRSVCAQRFRPVRATPRAHNGPAMRASALVVALGLALASAKREPAFIPAEDEDTKDPSLNFEPVKSVHYHNVLTKAGRQPVLMAYLDDALEDYAKVHTTFNRAAADFGCLLPERNYMLAAGKDARARFIVDGEGIEMPSVSIFRRKRKVTFAGNWNETELREWVYKELAGLSFVEEDAEYDAFVKKGEKTAVRAWG